MSSLAGVLPVLVVSLRMQAREHCPLQIIEMLME